MDEPKSQLSSSFILLQTSTVCPVFESIRVSMARQLHVTVLAFSCLMTTQCSIVSAAGGGIWLRIGGGVTGAGCFFAAHPDRMMEANRQAKQKLDFMSPVFARRLALVDGNLGYTLWRPVFRIS